MNMNDSDKDLLLNNTARTYSRITLYKDGEQIAVCTEDDYIEEWTYEDYRYVPEQGFIGQFVERLLDGKFLNLPESLNINDCELKLELGIKGPNDQNPTYYDYGKFLITKVSDTDTNGIVSFESSDYTKKFNVKYEDRVTYPCLSMDLLEDICDQAGVECGNVNGTAMYATPTEDVTWEADDYCFKNGSNYIKFTTTHALNKLDSLVYLSSTNTVYQTVVSDDSVTTTELTVTTGSSAVGTELSVRTCPYITGLANQFFVIDSNQFESDQSLRDVVKAIAKLNYTWARIGNDNKLYLDFTKKDTTDVDEYTTIDEDHYYSATRTGDTYGPVDAVSIGMSAVEGEEVTNTRDGYDYSAAEFQIPDGIEAPVKLKLEGDTSQISGVLPSEYKQVEYIQYTGTQYIDTGFQPNLDNGFKFEVRYGMDNLSGRSCLLSNYYGVQKHVSFEMPDNSYNVRAYYKDGTIDKRCGDANLQINNATFEMTPTSYKITQNSASETGSVTADGTSAANVYMFIDNNKRFSTFTRQIKMYRCKIYDGPTLVRDFVPCYKISGTVIGMYDIVNGVFYENAGTGTFVKGDSVTSPNHEYPQDVHVVSGNNTVNVQTKNLIPTNKSLWESGHYNTSGVKTAFATRMRTIDLIPCLPNTTYYVIGANFFIREFDSGKTFINDKGIVYPNNSFITGANTSYLGISVEITYNNYAEGTNKIAMFYNSETDKTWTIGAITTYPLNLPVQNLFDKSNATVVSGYFRDSALNQLVINSSNSNKTIIFTGQPNTTYTISKTLGNRFRVGLYNSVLSANGTYTFDSNAICNDTATSMTITTTSTNRYIYVHIFETGELQDVLDTVQIEVGLKANRYTAYGTTPMIFCEAGNSKDYIYRGNDDKWYKKVCVRRLSLPISNMNNGETYPGWGSVPSIREDLGTGHNGWLKGITDFYCNITAPSYGGIAINTNGTNSVIWLSKGSFWNLTQTQWKAIYPNLVVDIYYALPNSYDEEITDAELISQLDAIYEMKTLNGQTNIIQTNNDQPFIINLTELRTILTLDDNPMTYTEELRRAAISSSDRLLGVTYTPVTVSTVGYPWLNGDDYVKIEDVDGAEYYTYPFNRTITYKGYIESSIDSIANSITQTKYDFESEVINRVKHTEILVDRNAGEIRLITESVDEINNDITNLDSQYAGVVSQLESVNASIDTVTSSVTQLQTDTYTKTEIRAIADGTGVDGVKVSAVQSISGKFDMDGMHYEKSDAPTKSTINEAGLKVSATDSNSTEVLYAGYDNVQNSDTYGQSIVRTDNLTVTKWTVVGKHGRFEEFTDTDNHEGVGFFLV